MAATQIPQRLSSRRIADAFRGPRRVFEAGRPNSAKSVRSMLRA
jgi:hypothetical protein